MEAFDLDLAPNEASDLAPIFGAAVLERHGWDTALVTVLDETPAEEALAVIAHQAGEPRERGWSAHRIIAKPASDAGKTTDAEACARRDGWVYLFGSQYGSKAGPIEAARSWVARVREDDLARRLEGGSKPKMEVARLRLGLHRAVNDALAGATGLTLAPLGPRMRDGFIDGTIIAGAKGDKRWADRVTSADVPINVEGVAFRGNGRLLLGLRYPVTADGRPLLVELDDLDALFADPDAVPSCRNVWILDGIGTPDRPVGVRALHSDGADVFDAVVGNLDAAGKSSALLDDWPQAGAADSAHVRFRLPAIAGGGVVAADLVHAFENLQRVEGVATIGREAHYVIDQDGAVGLRSLMLG